MELSEISIPSYWFFFRNGELMVSIKDGSAKVLPVTDIKILNEFSIGYYLFIGSFQGYPCYSAALPAEAIIPDGFALKSIFLLYDFFNEDFFWIAAKSYQILNWSNTHQFCRLCGTALKIISEKNYKTCPQCNLPDYPPVTPAIIVAVIKDDDILLARHPYFPPGLFTVIAGFVEPCETLEECVRREVYEEVGIEVDDVKYFGSLPWPFPHSLMIAFTAKYKSGEIKVDGNEIIEAGWFKSTALPQIPGKISMANRLIEWFIQSNKKS